MPTESGCCLKLMSLSVQCLGHSPAHSRCSINDGCYFDLSVSPDRCVPPLTNHLVPTEKSPVPIHLIPPLKSLVLSGNFCQSCKVSGKTLCRNREE